ncbi:GerMN domain-containing protein [Promicromonospora panici]|uniref:GerMN domain-containing protein n=1 Tax=Promicromonospora panici TaxID=2219658 RepID=UPI00101CB656|nr:GerMN domain-containing protein [Promicromonospora panici]
MSESSVITYEGGFVVDLKLTVRRYRRTIAVTAAAALLVPAAAFSAAGQGQAAAQLQQQEELLGQSVVTDVSETEQVVHVDVAQDPAAADAWLDESAEVLDGWTVVVAGMESKPGKERAELDAEAVADDPVPPAEECPEIPEGPRSGNGATTPYLGCGPNEGVHATARTVKGGPSTTTLAKAVDEVLASYLPGADLPSTKVRISKGEATVDVAAGFERALAHADVDPGDVWQALLFTAHSNGAIDSVRFTLDGDCLAFAYATGGDMCASTDLPIELD